MKPKDALWYAAVAGMRVATGLALVATVGVIASLVRGVERPLLVLGVWAVSLAIIVFHNLWLTGVARAPSRVRLLGTASAFASVGMGLIVIADGLPHGAVIGLILLYGFMALMSMSAVIAPVQPHITEGRPA